MLKQKVDENGQISIIIPTYNESENIIQDFTFHWGNITKKYSNPSHSSR